MQMYLGGAALAQRYPRLKLAKCMTKGCKSQSSFVLASLAGTQLSSQHCGGHVMLAASRRAVPIVTDPVELEQRLEPRKTVLERELQEAKAAREAAELATHGRALKAAGRRGKVYVRQDGAVECELQAGMTIRPCCLLEALRMAGVQKPARDLVGHTGCCQASGRRRKAAA